jgi:type IV pilus assembly protein PilM
MDEPRREMDELNGLGEPVGDARVADESESEHAPEPSPPRDTSSLEEEAPAGVDERREPDAPTPDMTANTRTPDATAARDASASPDAAATPDATAIPDPTETLPSAPSVPEQARRRLALRRERPGKSESRESKHKRIKKLIGLKIGASQIAAARVVNNGVPELVEVVREPLEPGIVVAGEIRDAEALAGALERFFERHKLPKRGVRLGIANNRIGVRVFEIEGVTDVQQLENAIRFRAEEVLPIPLADAVLDYAVLDESVREDGTPVRRILLVVAYREVVDRYLQACRGAGLDVVGIDLEAFALLRSLAAPADRDSHSGALVAVAIGHDRTIIAVSNGRFCEFTRVLDWGGWSLNVAVARALDMAPSEVEGIKRQLSFAEETSVEGLTPERVAKTREGIERALAGFARELVASLHFYQAQPGALGIGEIVITGGAAHMRGLADSLGRLIGVSVRVGDPFRRVTFEHSVGEDDQPGSLAVAIGLGIED